MCIWDGNAWVMIVKECHLQTEPARRFMCVSVPVRWVDAQTSAPPLSQNSTPVHIWHTRAARVVPINTVWVQVCVFWHGGGCVECVLGLWTVLGGKFMVWPLLFTTQQDVDVTSTWGLHLQLKLHVRGWDHPFQDLTHATNVFGFYVYTFEILPHQNFHKQAVITMWNSLCGHKNIQFRVHILKEKRKVFKFQMEALVILEWVTAERGRERR